MATGLTGSGGYNTLILWASWTEVMPNLTKSLYSIQPFHESWNQNLSPIPIIEE